MKIIKTAQEAKKPQTRDEWIEDFCKLCPAAKEVPTGFRDSGAAVQMELPSGAVAQWQWRGITAAAAIQEARDAGLLPHSPASVAGLF